MRKVERGEVLGLAEYEVVRERFRGRVIAEKKLRRVPLGDRASCLFENHDTVLLQIQEMLRTERITREAAVLHEIETYNEQIPGPRELSATVMIEIEDKATRDAFLLAARGLEQAFALEVDGERCPATHDERRVLADRTTTVHYLKFPLGERAFRALAEVGSSRKPGEVVVEVTVSHAAYSARARLEPATVASLAEDLAP